LNGTTSSFCGTPDYIAAEIVGAKPYTFTADWWSLGVLVFELVSGKTPFRADNSEGIYNNIQSGKIKWVPQVTGPIKDLCTSLLLQDPNLRLGCRGAIEVKNARWFSDISWEKLSNRQIQPPLVPPYATPETLEMEKVIKFGVSDYTDILSDKENEKKNMDEKVFLAFKGF
jgi:protein kinase A